MPAADTPPRAEAAPDPALGEFLARLQRLEAEVQALRRDIALHYRQETVPPGDLELVVCRVGSSTAGFLQAGVMEVVPVPRLSPLPEAPFWVQGVFDLRGSLVSVIDVLARFAGRPRQLALSDLVVVGSVEGRSVGFLVQEIVALRRCEGARVEEPRDVPAAPYLMGVVQLDGTPVLVLSTRALVRLAGLAEGTAE